MRDPRVNGRVGDLGDLDEHEPPVEGQFLICEAKCFRDVRRRHLDVVAVAAERVTGWSLHKLWNAQLALDAELLDSRTGLQGKHVDRNTGVAVGMGGQDWSIGDRGVYGGVGGRPVQPRICGPQPVEVLASAESTHFDGASWRGGDDLGEVSCDSRPSSRGLGQAERGDHHGRSAFGGVM